MKNGTSKPKPKPRPRPKGGKGYRFPTFGLIAALAGSFAATACDDLKGKPTPDEVMAEVERHACYSRAGLAAEAALREKCPTQGTEAERSFQLALCPHLESLLKELENQLEKCDE